MRELSQTERDFLKAGRVARLATAGPSGRLLVVPICYAFDGQAFYSSIDQKPKQGNPLQLERIRNILQNPHFSLVVDRYEEDWGRLAYVLVRGKAELLTQGSGHQQGVGLLQSKYPQYGEMDIRSRPLLCLRPGQIKSWGLT